MTAPEASGARWLSGAARWRVRACRTTSWPSPMRTLAAPRPSPSVEPVMKIRATGEFSRRSVLVPIGGARQGPWGPNCAARAPETRREEVTRKRHRQRVTANCDLSACLKAFSRLADPDRCRRLLPSQPGRVARPDEAPHLSTTAGKAASPAAPQAGSITGIQADSITGIK